MRTLFQDTGEETPHEIGHVSEHPHFYEGKLLCFNQQHYMIQEIRSQDIGKPLYVVPITLLDAPQKKVHDSMSCPYCAAEWEDGILGQTHDTLVDCQTCNSVSHVQRVMDCEVLGEYYDIIYLVTPKIQNEIIYV